jgi:hypothetical protein
MTLILARILPITLCIKLGRRMTSMFVSSVAVVSAILQSKTCCVRLMAVRSCLSTVALQSPCHKVADVGCESSYVMHCRCVQAKAESNTTLVSHLPDSLRRDKHLVGDRESMSAQCRETFTHQATRRRVVRESSSVRI